MSLSLGLPLFCAQQDQPNGLPNISAKPTSGLVVSADFLAWYASEEVASIWADVINIGNNTSSWGAPGFDFVWDYGFRVGVGYDLGYDGWDTLFSWTWFQTSANHSLSSTPSSSLHFEFDAGFLSGDTPDSMNASWSLLYDMFDWSLGRSYWISRGLSVRPFFGAQGGWIHQSIKAHYQDLTVNSVKTQESGQEQLKNNFWGIGTLGGINTKWKVYDFGSHYFDFVGDFSLATMWGNWTCSDFYQSTLPKTYTVSMKDSALGALMCKGLVGIGWDVDISKGKSHFSAKLGYEMQIWLNQLRIATFQLQRLHHDLTLQGVTLNCQYDF